MSSLLEQLRHPSRVRNIKAVVIFGLFGLICLMFVFTGLTPDRGGVTGNSTAATVNQTVISAQDLQERVSQYEAQAGPDKGMPAAQRQMRTQRIRENALQELVSYEVVFQSAQNAGILPTAAATRSLIVNIPAFQEDGRFAREMYQRYLQYRNISAGEFESKVKRDVVISQVRDIFFSAWAQPTLIDDLQNQARDTKLNLEVIKIDPKTLASSSVSAEDVGQYLAKAENKEKAKSYFSSHKEEFSTPDQIRARHILLKGDTDAVLKKAQEIKKGLTKANFAEQAKKFSEDQGSKDKGGDLNYFSRGQMVPEFEAVAFGLKVGQISEPVKSPFGYHIILLDDKRAAEVKTFEVAEKEIARNLAAEEKREKVNEEFATGLKGKGDIGGLLARYNLKWQDLGAVSVTQNFIDKVESGDQIIEAALNLKPGQVYPDLVRAGPQSYVVRLKSVVVAAEKSDSKKSASSLARFGGGGEALGLWAEELRKESRIRLNDSMMK